MPSHQPPEHGPFRHEALLYRALEGFVAGTVPFIQEGVDAGEPVLVITAPERLEALRDALGDRAEIAYGDMTTIGRNPGRIISEWVDFAARHPGRPVRGIGEPIWAGRSPDELLEAQHHEMLLNVALADVPAFVLCPYDTDALDDEVIAEAARSHPTLVRDGRTEPSAAYAIESLDPFSGPLSEPDDLLAALDFDTATLSTAREQALALASASGFPPDRAQQVVLAVGEAVANSLRHGGGVGRLRIWRDDDRLVCEVTDTGRVASPMAGRVRPDTGRDGGFGLWLIHQLCDLVQVRSGEAGTVVRMHFRHA